MSSVDTNTPDFDSPEPPEGAGNLIEDPAPGTSGATAGDGGVAAEFGTYNSKQTTIAGTLYQYFNPPGETQTFSADMGAPLERWDELKHLTVVDEEWAGTMLRELEDRRILLLVGDKGSGKGTIAKYLATRMVETQSARLPVRVVAPLEKRIRLVMRKAAEEKNGFAASATIFWNAFAKRNADLLSFVATDRSVCEHVARLLREHHGYLILTSPAIDLDPIRGRLTDAVVLHEIPEAGAAEIVTAVERRLAWIAQRRPDRAGRVQEVTKVRDELIAARRTIPNICRFIDEIVDNDDDISVALNNSDRGAGWFVNDIADDVDAWCFALTAGLTGAAKDAEPVSWSTFEELRRTITDRIRGDTEMFPPRRFRADNAEDAAVRTAGASLSDDVLLQRCGIVIRKDRDGIRDVVTFRHQKRLQEVWPTLLTHHRRVVSILVPLLRRIAEREQSGLSLRVLAAQILGRLGEVDPTSITLPLIEHQWIGSRRIELRPLVGSLLQGVAGSESPKYRRLALDALDRLAATAPEDLDQDGQNRLVTAIAAYAQLGEWDEAEAMERLGEIAIEHCGPKLTELYSLLMEQETVDRAQRRTRSKRRLEALRVRGRGLTDAVRQKLAEQAPILVALEKALTMLCLTVDVADILDKMRSWVSRGGSSTRTLVTMLFLHDTGIADQLSEFGIGVDSAAGIHPLIFSAATSRAALHTLCGFLADLHGSIKTPFALPGDVQRDLQERFEECLTSWARSAVTVPAFRETFEELFLTLSRVRGKALAPDLYRLVNDPSFNQDAPMAELATAIRKRIEL